MKNVVITFNNDKTFHYLNAEYHYENGDIVITEYDNEYAEIGKYYIPESEVKEIKYEG